MKNYFEFRGTAKQLVFDPVAKAFTTRTVPHGFTAQRDGLSDRMLADLGLDATAAARGELKIAA